MARALAALSRGALSFTPQPSAGVTYAAKIGNDDARVDWTRPARAVHNHVRGLAPFPGAFAEVDVGRGAERLKVLRTEPLQGSGAPGDILDANMTVACGEGALRLLSVQRAGKSAVSGAEFMRGARLVAGSRLT
jgi:methionyl-tRNA formyltransferase